MAIGLNNIKPAKGATKKKKRVGRGNSSGHGTYSTRGLKGQKSRKGVSGLKRLGMKQVLLRTPKKRGFKSPKPKAQVIDFTGINSKFKDNDHITPMSLLKKGLVESASLPIKVLNSGELKLKKLSFSKIRVSNTAADQIKKSGGQIQ